MPASPHLAADRENKQVDTYAKLPQDAEVIGGAGGVAVPLNQDGYTWRDWLRTELLMGTISKCF